MARDDEEGGRAADPEAGPPSSPRDPEDEAVLVAALRAGDAGAFERLVRSQGPRLLAVARRILRSEEDARDCLQETFLAAHRSLAQYEGRAPLAAWLRRIAVNSALMRLRARRARPETTIDELLPVYDAYGLRAGPTRTHDLTPEELLRRTDTRKLVHQALDELPDGYREVLLLRDIEGYSTAETAELLQATPGAVKVRVHRARSALKALLAPLFEEDLR